MEETVCVVTGANAGLGFAIACRFIDEFLLLYPPASPSADAGASSPQLTICITTRTEAKASSTLNLLKQHVAKRHAASDALPLKLEYILLDLCCLDSVSSAGKQLNARYTHITHFFCNAGMGDFIGIDWPLAAMDILSRNINALTYPTFKLQGIGKLTAHANVLGIAIEDHQTKMVEGDGECAAELGAVFCANVFGHYYLLHEIMQLLRTQKGTGRSRSKVVWMSSLESYGRSLDIDDIQGIKSPESYESSKRLTDILALTSNEEGTRPDVEAFMTPSGVPAQIAQSTSMPPLFALCHPGIVATAIVPLPLVLVWAMTLAFYLCRWAGSPWHCCEAYVGAVAPVWAALTDDVHELEGRKWGSSCNRRGRAFVRMTDIDEGWQEFGAPAWAQMERLRTKWKSRIDH